MSFNIMELQKMADTCIKGEPAFCVNSCPLKFDIISFLNKIQNGKFNSAFSTYRNLVLFPHIVSAICDGRCGDNCIRQKFGGKIDIRKIEEAVCTYANNKRTIDYYVPLKDKTVAIIGAGLGGMGCAVKLAKRGYYIDLYEKEDKIGGRLWKETADVLDVNDLETDLKSIYDDKRIRLIISHEVRSIDELSSYDAVYIATGTAGDRFNLERIHEKYSLATNMAGVFINDLADTNHGPIDALRNGILVATEIEGFLKVGRTDVREDIYKNTPTKLQLPLNDMNMKASNQTKAEGRYTKEEAVEEARRCLLCDCSGCIDKCKMLNKYKKYPEKIIEDVNATLNVMEGYTVRIASRQINSCNLCGACSQDCPTNFDFEQLFLNSRIQMQKAGDVPPAYHDYWIRDMYHALSDSAYGVFKIGEKCDYVFFPGCQLGCSDPEYVVNTYSFLAEHLDRVGVFLSCCGAPAYWAGQQELFEEVIQSIECELRQCGNPTLVVSCPSCQKILERHLKDICIISIYEVLKEYPMDIDCNYSRIAAIFDPCASIGFKDMQDSVRDVLNAAGIKINAYSDGSEKVRCCGYGGHIHAVDRELLDDIVYDRVNSNDDDFITYCINCRDSFASVGKRSCHILDLLFKNPSDSLEKRMLRKVPDLSQKRKNREETKRRMEEAFHMDIVADTQEELELYIDDNLINKMNRQLIIREDICAVINNCENSGNKLFNKNTNSFIGHLKMKYITYWVEYKPENQGFRVINVYSHRMSIEEEYNL